MKLYLNYILTISLSILLTGCSINNYYGDEERASRVFIPRRSCRDRNYGSYYESQPVCRERPSQRVVPCR